MQKCRDFYLQKKINMNIYKYINLIIYIKKNNKYN